SPMRSAQRRGLRFNLHNDSPVVPPDILRLVWSAAARRTRSNQVLGAEQAISVAAAFRAVTLDAAYAHFEEESKGSIAAGKLADLVVLSANPTSVPLDQIQAITVEATLKEGVIIHGAL
ncbi:MAG: amidohydrolase family protein, partial [Tepidiformaceae bacterium]